MVMMEFKNLLMLGCLICCMSPCMSQACIDDNNQLQCRYDCSDEVITDKCFQFDATNHPPIDGYCCPGYFLTNVTEPKCQICRDNKFMPDINKCCGCITCMECDLTVDDYILVDFCPSKIKNRLCKIEKDHTTPANVTCPFIMTSTRNPPTTIEVNTVQVTSTSDVPVVRKSRNPYRAGFYVVLPVFLFLLIPVLFICFFVCWAYKTAPMDEGRKDGVRGAAPANGGRNNRNHEAAPANEGSDVDVTVVDTTNKGRKDRIPSDDNMSWKEIARLIAKKIVRTATDKRRYHQVNSNEMQANPNWRNNENTSIVGVDEVDEGV